MKRYRIINVFTDDITGTLSERPGMRELLAFVRKHRTKRPVVLIDDVTRLARSVKAHIALREAISAAGGILESPTPTVGFGEDADSELREYILATVSPHQRRKNAEQTRNRMQARVTNGFWPFACPIGYQHKRVRGYTGKVLVPHEPLASTIREALEGYASGRFQLQAEVKRFLEA